MVVSIDSGRYQWQIRDNCLYFTGENYSYPLHLCLEMDSAHGGPAYGTDDLYFCTQEQKTGLHPVIEKLDDERVCFTLKEEEHFSPGSRKGNRLVMRHRPRSQPAFYVGDSGDVSLEKVTVKG